MSKPLVAIAPEPPFPWAVEQVEAAGAEVVPPEEAEALVWMHPKKAAALQDVLARGPGIRWVQLPWAGVEDFAAVGVFADGRTWTCAKGVYAEPVAEHALALGLYGLRHLHERTIARSWGPQVGRTLFGGRVTIVGGGGITVELLRLLAPFGVDATVVRRQPEPLAGAARTLTVDRLHEALRGADLVVLALALTPETHGIVAAPELRVMEPHAWLVNVARGRHVVTDDLVTALREDWIGGAALDVTEPEPLPDGHPLWDLPNCLITSHSANTLEMAEPHLARRIRENIRRFRDGEELIGLVDAERGY